MSRLLKIVVIGGESTGKSTLCFQLAKHFSTVWVEEYARSYLEKLNRTYIESDLEKIAEGQLLSEKNQLLNASQFLFCDTDLHVIKVWSEHKYGQCKQSILNQIAVQHCDAYILTTPDFPWQEDPLREHPEPVLRMYFFKQYLDIVSNSNYPFCIVNGIEEKRLQTSIDFLKRLKSKY